MKTLLVVTYVDFWRKGSGHRARISSMMIYLKSKAHITVFFAGIEKVNDKILLRESFSGINFEFACSGMTLTFRDYKEKFKNFIKDKFFDIALIEYIELSSVLEYLPASTITLLDTHDLIFDRIKSFKKFNLEYDGIVLSKQEELDIYKCYDYIILIQKNDFECIAKKMEAHGLLLVPHPAILKRKKIRKKAKHVGYIASQYKPNVEALKWFINNVWDKIHEKYSLTLNIYGNIRHAFYEFSGLDDKNIVFHGFVDDLEKAYYNSDIMINPIRCGAGLKIKNVEALGYGLPLVTTTHGASGIEDGASKAFLTANNAKEFLSAFDAIVENYDFRKQIGKDAFRYAQLHFSAETCYNNLLEIVN